MRISVDLTFDLKQQGEVRESQFLWRGISQFCFGAQGTPLSVDLYASSSATPSLEKGTRLD